MSLNIKTWITYSDSVIFFYGEILAHFTLFSSKLSLYMSIVKTQNLVFVRDFVLKTILQYSQMVCSDKSNRFWLIWLVLKKGIFFPKLEKNVTKTSECVLWPEVDTLTSRNVPKWTEYWPHKKIFEKKIGKWAIPHKIILYLSHAP